MRRETTVSTLTLDLDVSDREVVDAVMKATGIQTGEDFLRAASYHLAVFVLGGRAVTTDTFRLRGAGKRAVGSLKIRQAS